MKTIAVVKEGKEGFKVLVNYIQRGIILHNIHLANREALNISMREHCDKLILAKEVA